MARKLRIAVWYNLPSGGAKRALHMHVAGLVARGHHVEIWRPPIPDKGFLPLSDIAPEHEVPLASVEAGGSYASKVLAHVARQTILMRAMERHSRACAGEIERGDFDVLFANTDRHFYAPFVGRSLSLPKALYLGEPNRFLYEAHPRLPWAALPKGASLKRRVRDLLDIRAYRVQVREERANAAAYDRILVNSLYSREAVLRAYALDSHVCYLGIDAAQFRDLGLPREPFAMGLGALVPTKGVRRAVEAIGAMPNPKPPLVWVANFVDETYHAAVREMAERLGVDFRPEVMASDDESWPSVRATALVYCPCLELFGLAALEAGACGLPVVAVAEGGVRETVADGVNGWLVESDPPAIARGLTDLLPRALPGQANGRGGQPARAGPVDRRGGSGPAGGAPAGGGGLRQAERDQRRGAVRCCGERRDPLPLPRKCLRGTGRGSRRFSTVS